MATKKKGGVTWRLIGLLFALACALSAPACSLDGSPFGPGPEEQVCTEENHCNDEDPCTKDICGKDGICVFTPMPQWCEVPDDPCKDVGGGLGTCEGAQPPSDSPCSVFVCAGSGVEADQASFVCWSWISVSVNDLQPVGLQVDGDCKVASCVDGVLFEGQNGLDDDQDVPDDNNDCTIQVCAGGTPAAPTSVDVGVTCNDNGGKVCDGAGDCVQCNTDNDCTEASKPKCSLNVCIATTCGDGTTQAPESCDDGNPVNGDGCDNNCTFSACGNGIKAGAEGCDDGNQVNTDSCPNNCVTAKCGDSVVWAGTELCDDGNLVSGDGCDANCKPTGCGNGVKAGTEACDDGNLVSGDGCDSDCTLTACGNGIVTVGEMCDDGNASDSDACLHTCLTAKCGDGFVYMGVEACDDGNNVSGDGCEPTCKITVVPGCGNGTLEGTEACDDGNLVSGDGCDANCKPTGCGNGVMTMGEVCDDGNMTSGDGCDANCKPTGCGNGVMTMGEACDDGNMVSGDGCESNCTITPPVGMCGNDIVEPGEDCDDGNNSNLDACVACKAAKCGDGFTQTGVEQCDDGNLINGDGCNSTCTGP